MVVLFVRSLGLQAAEKLILHQLSLVSWSCAMSPQHSAHQGFDTWRDLLLHLSKRHLPPAAQQKALRSLMDTYEQANSDQNGHSLHSRMLMAFLPAALTLRGPTSLDELVCYCQGTCPGSPLSAAGPDPTIDAAAVEAADGASSKHSILMQDGPEVVRSSQAKDEYHAVPDTPTAKAAGTLPRHRVTATPASESSGEAFNDAQAGSQQHSDPLSAINLDKYRHAQGQGYDQAPLQHAVRTGALRQRAAKAAAAARADDAASSLIACDAQARQMTSKEGQADFPGTAEAASKASQAGLGESNRSKKKKKNKRHGKHQLLGNEQESSTSTQGASVVGAAAEVPPQAKLAMQSGNAVASETQLPFGQSSSSATSASSSSKGAGSALASAPSAKMHPLMESAGHLDDEVSWTLDQGACEPGKHGLKDCTGAAQDPAPIQAKAGPKKLAQASHQPTTHKQDARRDSQKKEHAQPSAPVAGIPELLDGICLVGILRGSQASNACFLL